MQSVSKGNFDMELKAHRGNGTLVLSRKISESVTLVDSRDGSVVAVVTVEKVCGNRASIGFKAPLHIGIRRSELENKEAASC